MPTEAQHIEYSIKHSVSQPLL